MKVTIIGSHLCPDTLFALYKLRENGIETEFKNLSSSLSDLKVYLAAREGDKIYEEVRKNGGIGIPLFEFPDGTRTLDLDEVLKVNN